MYTAACHGSGQSVQCASAFQMYLRLFVFECSFGRIDKPYLSQALSIRPPVQTQGQERQIALPMRVYAKHSIDFHGVGSQVDSSYFMTEDSVLFSIK